MRQRTLLASSQSITSQCKKAVEAIGLVNPGVQFNLYERRMNAFQGTGGEVRHVAGVSAGVSGMTSLSNPRSGHPKALFS